MTDILKLINPLHRLSVDTIWSVAVKSLQSRYAAHSAEYQLQLYRHFKRILTNYEQLLGLRLRKEMFVCDLKEPHWKDFPKLTGFDSKKLEDATALYNEAQSKVIFEGLKSMTDDWLSSTKDIPAEKNILALFFRNNGIQFTVDANDLYFSKSFTISDLITEVNRYNRHHDNTSQIHIPVNQNFVNLLVQ